MHKSNLPTLLNSFTPLFLAFIGGTIAIVTILKAPPDAQFAAAMGLAGSAIAGAAGLSQPSRNESSAFESKKNEDMN